MSSTTGIASLLPERYRLQERLGAGGMATVYKAEDTHLRRTVAIKVLHEHLVYEASFRERFEQEAHIVAGFNHPNIIQIYDFAAVENNGQQIYYMVMPYIPGKTLADLLDEIRAEDKTLPHDRIQRIMLDLTSALGYAHDRGMVHRDVKPGNILFDEHDRAILTDFGIARLAQHSNLTQEGLIVGTPAYMSPEQATAQPVDGRADIYALGIILFEMLSGHTPFEDDGTLSLLLKHVEAPVPSLTGIMQMPIQDIDIVLSKALAKTPEKRYQTADGFAIDIAMVFSGKKLTPVDDSPPPETREFPRPQSPITHSEKPKIESAAPPSSRVITAFSTVIIKPARQNPLAFVALAVALVALLIVARVMQTPPAVAVGITPTPAPDTDSMTGDFYFKSDFAADDSLNSRWQQNDSGAMTRVIDNGMYVLANTESGRATPSLFDIQYSYHNVTITMSATLADDSAQTSGYGIIFRYQDANNYNVFAVDGMGRYSIWTLQAGDWRELRELAGETWTSDEAIHPAGESNTLTLTVYDNMITGMVNGEKVVSLTEDTFDSGGIGVYMATPSSGTATVGIDSYEVAAGMPVTDSMTDDTDSMTDDSVDTMTGDSTEEAGS